MTLRNEGHFRYHPEKLKSTVDLVVAVTQANYPDLKIPFHSRWGHFRVGGIDRVAQLDEKLRSADRFERARVKLDLAVTSVLLDAGAGMQWSYLEKSSGQRFSKSEGLAVASFDLFMAGAFANDGKSPRADGEALQTLTPEQIAKAFQVSEQNPLIGVEGRTQLMNNLGKTLLSNDVFKGNDGNTGRPGNILDYLHAKYGNRVPASGLLRAVLDGFGPIWPGRLQMEGRNLGDVWKHSKLGLIPIHKLSQWLTYSLIEPLIAAGIEVVDIEELTGLAEYRNGGLLLDSGLLEFAEAGAALKAWLPDSDLIIEWRALTVHLLEFIAHEVRETLHLKEQEFPLPKVLEGGTWWAGRKIAKEKRADGGPPLNIQSDGTVF